MEVESGSTISQCVENSFLKQLYTYRKTEYRMNKLMNESEGVICVIA
jgi:hypothetical protein